MSATTVRVGTGEALGCPEIGQVASRDHAEEISSVWSILPARPAIRGRSSTATAIATARRIRCAAPNGVLSISRAAAEDTSKREFVPEAYGI